MILQAVKLATGKEVTDILNEMPAGSKLEDFSPWQAELFPPPQIPNQDFGTALVNLFAWIPMVYFGPVISVRIEGTCYSLFRFNYDLIADDELRGLFTLIKCEDNAFVDYIYP